MIFLKNKIMKRNFFKISLIILLSESCCFISPTHAQKKTAHGILYFSFDNGNRWEDASDGLPQKIKIGLGSIAASEKILGLATKEEGIFLYNFTSKFWEKIPTDQQIIEANIGPLAIMDSTIWVGTQWNGIFCTKNRGKTWENLSQGLSHKSIRRFSRMEQKFFVCTNDGLYIFGEKDQKWQLVFGQRLLQANGATMFKGQIYLATDKGIFTKKSNKTWLNIAPQWSVHHIGSVGNKLYALTYSELRSWEDGGVWRNEQNGLPQNLYTFQVIAFQNWVFAGQWDGVYRKSKFDFAWQKSSAGLPPNFAVTNLIAMEQLLVADTSER
jgi:hypothetical protein